jgi:putative ABC transport system ATP-binding protein
MLSSSQLHFSYNTDTQFLFPAIVCQSSEMLLITGSSGKGKTTLLHLLAGILKPSGGSVTINNTNICLLSGKRLGSFRGQHIGIIFQQSHFVDSLSVLENIVLAQYLSGRKKNDVAAKQLLNELGVGSQINKRPAQLSIGQQQRVSIARALINKPDLLLADEPTSSLDDENCLVVAELLQQQARQYNTALVIVTHDNRLKSIFHQSVHLS